MGECTAPRRLTPSCARLARLPSGTTATIAWRWPTGTSAPPNHRSRASSWSSRSRSTCRGSRSRGMARLSGAPCGGPGSPWTRGSTSSRRPRRTRKPWKITVKVLGVEACRYPPDLRARTGWRGRRRPLLTSPLKLRKSPLARTCRRLLRARRRNGRRRLERCSVRRKRRRATRSDCLACQKSRVELRTAQVARRRGQPACRPHRLACLSEPPERALRSTCVPFVRTTAPLARRRVPLARS
jgi:hypothetical protein